MYQKLCEVDMDAVLFTTSKKTVLITHGITTCIAFIIRGSFWNEDEEQTRFCGLYHWSGFDVYAADPNEQTSKALIFFLDKLRAFSGVEDDALINIESLQFIGGEREQRDENNEIILSGTEKEVSSLVQIVSNFKFFDHGFNIKPSAVKHYHFLTTDEQSISINLTTVGCNFEIENLSTSESLEYHSNSL